MNISNNGSNKTITFSGELQTNGLSGTVSAAIWECPDMMPTLRKLFHCRDNETIEAIEVTDRGISARIGHR